MLDSLFQDLRFGAAQLLRRPSYALLSISALALGIGATAAIFSAVSAVVLHPFPFREPSQLVMLWQSNRTHPAEQIEIGWGHYAEWRKQSKAFESFGLLSSVNLDFSITGEGEPFMVEGVTATATFFETLGVKPALGRWYTQDEDKPGASARAVISYRLWQSRYAGDRNVLGRKISLGGFPVTIVGVTPADFDFPHEAELFLPLGLNPSVEKMQWFRVYRAIGRVKPGVSMAAAQAEMDVIAARLEKEYPAQNKELGVRLVSMDQTVYGNARIALWVMLGAVFVVLLIACANVSNLMLARATNRGGEMAVRAALGATRGRLIQQLLGESFVLALCGGIAGALLAYAGVKAIVALAPGDIPRVAEIAVSPSVLAFTLGITLVTTLICGLFPALQASRVNLQDTLKEAGEKGSGSRSTVRWRNLLIASEVALSVVLLTGAGLLIRTFLNLNSIDPGFATENILTFRVTLQDDKYQKQENRRAFYGQLVEKLNALPGVESAAAILLRPLSGTVGWDNYFTVEGQNPQEQAGNPTGNYEAISPGYFRTVGIKLIEGRDFSTLDTEKAPGVVVINESTARRFWPGQSAIGKRLKLGKPDSPAPFLTVSGVVEDVRYREWEVARADAYIPYTQRAQHRSDFVVKTKVDPLTLVSAVRQAVYSMEKDQPISKVATMESLVGEALARPRFNMLLLTIFATCALLLAGLGIFSVLSYTVAQRTREIGIRMALGGTSAKVLKLVMGSGLSVVAAGLSVGLIASYFLTRTMETLLYATKPNDALTFTLGTLLLLIIASLACAIPAWRATRIHPREALSNG